MRGAWMAEGVKWLTHGLAQVMISASRDGARCRALGSVQSLLEAAQCPPTPIFSLSLSNK